MERFAFPRLGKLSVSEVTSADVVEALRAVWHERPATAPRVRQRMSTTPALMRADGVLPFVIRSAAGPWDAPPTGASCSPAPPASERPPAQDAAGGDRRGGPVSRARTASRGDAFGGASSVAAFGTDVRATKGVGR